MQQKAKKAICNIAAALSFIALAVAAVLLLQALLMPKYMSHPFEGGMMREYYSAGTEHDVIFLGDCEFYGSISPVTLFEEYGISSYVRGSSQQLIFHSYYILLDTLKYETPDVVVFNAVEMKIGQVEKEEYTRLTLDGMRLSGNKLAAAKMSLTEGETLLSYALPILRYHSRWNQLTGDDFEYWLKKDKISYNGYLMSKGSIPLGADLPIEPLIDYSLPEICWEYLDKIRLLCEERGIEFVLFKAPPQNWHYYWYDEWEAQLDAYAAEHGVLYINGIEHVDEMGLDAELDTYDGGVHLNVSGAEKCTIFLGKVLKEKCSLPDRRDDPSYVAAWDDVCRRYHTARDGGGDGTDTAQGAE